MPRRAGRPRAASNNNVINKQRINLDTITWWARQGELPKAMNARANEGYVARSASRVEKARAGIVLRGSTKFLDRNIGGPARTRTWDQGIMSPLL